MVVHLLELKLGDKLLDVVSVSIVEGFFFDGICLVEPVFVHAVGWDLSSRIIFHWLNEIRFREVLYEDDYDIGLVFLVI